MNMTTYNVLDIVRGTTVDGPGFRTAVYLAGCNHRCPGCHNPQSWDPSGGTPMTLQQIIDIVADEDYDVTLTGGDPLYNPDTTRSLIEAIHRTGHTVWLYTGYTYGQILASPRLAHAALLADAIVEGPFVEALRDADLLFRGSSNQRIIKPPYTPTDL